jgi:uncharacterized FlgJ-related protein
MKKIFIFDKDSLTFKNIKTQSYVKIGTYLVGAFAVLFILGWLSGTNNYIVNKFINTTEVTDTLTIHGQPFSEEALVETLKKCNVKYPHIVLAQAKLESGNFSSKIFKQNHNMFGMRKAKQRITTAESEKNGYAYFRDWVDGIHDYCMYQSSVLCNITNEDEYFAKLSEKYAEDTTYVSKLKNIIKNEKLKKIFED